MKRDFSRLDGKSFDLLVCGGGIYGAWTAYDAALRGLKVALIDQGDWGGATSSASSKLIHGGLRYLERFEFKLVRKSLSERGMLLDVAPHRVWPLRFGVPVYKDSRVGALRLKAGLMLYDFLAGKPGAELSHRHFSRSGFSGRFPLLNEEGLRGGFTYADAQTDDARMVLELIDGAIGEGAVCVNYCRMTGWIEENGRAVGATVENLIDNARGTIHARRIVRAAGHWAAAEGGERCRLTKGVHIVMPASDLNEALLLTAKSDGRVFFIIPWYGRTLVGTTDTDYRGDLQNVRVDAKDIAYLLDAANHYLKRAWSAEDVIGSFAGLRAMAFSNAAPSAVSRGWKLEIAPNGVHYSVGGKFTSAREDAATIVNSVCATLGVEAPCSTWGRPFPWAPEGNYAERAAAMEAQARQLGMDRECAGWLIRRHGKRAPEILRSMAEKPELAARVVADLPFSYGDLLFCAGNEMAVHLTDLLRRRLPLLILARLDETELRRLARLVAPALGWDEAIVEREIAGCREWQRQSAP